MWHVKVEHNTGVYVPNSFRIVCGFFYVLQEPDKCKSYGFSSLSEKIRKSIRSQISLQRQHFLLSYLKTLSVGPTGARSPRPPAQQTSALPTEPTRRRTSTGSEAFSFLMCLDNNKFVLQSFLSLVKTIYPMIFSNQTTHQLCKKSTSGWRPSLKNALA